MKHKLPLIEKALPCLKTLSNPCKLCQHKCNVNRSKGEKGLCRSSEKASVYSYSPHHGEEPPLSGTKGSGTIFFTHCNLKCVYCQNYEFSQESDFEEIDIEELANRMLELADMGCHNINLVSPTHQAYQIVSALQIAIKKSLNLPVVYNTGGYDSIELIKLLDGIIDIYLPDMRYSQDEMAKKFSGGSNYVTNNRAILKEMFRQVGILKADKNNIAKKGVIVRLLILPNSVSGTTDSLKFLSNEVSNKIYLSVMSQYYPVYLASNFQEISRRINEAEYKEALEAVDRFGFTNGWIQGFKAESERFLGTNIKPSY